MNTALLHRSPFHHATFVRSAMRALVLGLAATLPLLLVVGSAWADDPADSQTVKMIRQLRANPALQSGKPFAIVVTLTAKPGSESTVEKTVREVMAPTREEPGNLTYDLHRDINNPRAFVVYERWKSVDALQTHFEQPYIKNALQVYANALDGELQATFAIFLDVKP